MVTKATRNPSDSSTRLSTVQLRRKKQHHTQLQGPQQEIVASESESGDQDPTTVGCILLILLVFTALAIVIFTGLSTSIDEAVMVSCAIAVCSTTIVSDTLHTAHISKSPFGVGILKMMSLHDLFMVPLLALPELLASLGQPNKSDDGEYTDKAFIGVSTTFFRLFLVAVFLQISTLVATHPDSRVPGEKGDLFN